METGTQKIGCNTTLPCRERNKRSTLYRRSTRKQSILRRVEWNGMKYVLFEHHRYTTCRRLFRNNKYTVMHKYWCLKTEAPKKQS